MPGFCIIRLPLRQGLSWHIELYFEAIALDPGIKGPGRLFRLRGSTVPVPLAVV